MTRRGTLWICVFALLAFGIGCMTAKGENPAEKRAFVRKMRDETLAELYRKKPALRSRVQGAPAYAVFSDVETKIMFAGAGSGYGIAVDNSSGKETFMRMAKIHGGVGMGIQKFRAVFVFRDRAAYRRFVDKGWQFGGGADASVKAKEKGAAASVELDASSPIAIYQLTDAGVAASATVAGSKYWKDDALN